MCTPRNVAAFTVFGWRYAAYGSAVTQPAAHSDNLRNKTRPDDFISPRPSNSFSGFAFQLVAASIYSQILFLATAIFCSENKKKSGKFYLVLERSGLHATLETETMMTFSPRITVTSVHVDYKSKKLFANVPPKKNWHEKITTGAACSRCTTNEPPATNVHSFSTANECR